MCVCWESDDSLSTSHEFLAAKKRKNKIGNPPHYPCCRPMFSFYNVNSLMSPDNRHCRPHSVSDLIGMLVIILIDFIWHSICWVHSDPRLYQSNRSMKKSRKKSLPIVEQRFWFWNRTHFPSKYPLNVGAFFWPWLESSVLLWIRLLF